MWFLSHQSSRHGVVAYADSLDCVGVIAGDVDSVQEVFSGYPYWALA